uniref:Pentacotripeptide-repeat region of PRORP domain-containing protein n=1 Tax=Rhodosorus marinus TaxID=101924 RepID=A0A7S0G8B2_9RHOD|mmetsp:Transcript_796/g.1209  ORF Transcript_796/g.1209 Transcript_796/m.1209 type:complete len:202 (+) Transcript_796:153-758(+)
MSSRELVKGWERSSGFRPFERRKKSVLRAFNLFNSRLWKGYIGRDIEVAHVTEGLADYGDFRRVAYTMLEVEGRGREPLDQCYGHWIRSLARGDQVDRVRSVIDHMRARNREVPLSVYNEALFALGKNGRVKECLLIKEELDKELRKLDDVTYTALINYKARKTAVERDASSKSQARGTNVRRLHEGACKVRRLQGSINNV